MFHSFLPGYTIEKVVAKIPGSPVDPAAIAREFDGRRLSPKQVFDLLKKLSPNPEHINFWSKFLEFLDVKKEFSDAVLSQFMPTKIHRR